MKRLSTITLGCVLTLLFTTLAFTGKPRQLAQQAKKAEANFAARQALYYWYFEPGNVYNDENSLAGEELEMWIYYDGVLINTNPLGGTLIEEGFYNNTNPHNEPAYYYLYAHFDY